MKQLFRPVNILVVWSLAMPAIATTSAPVVEAQDDTSTVAWIPKALDNPAFELGRGGCMQAAREKPQF